MHLLSPPPAPASPAGLSGGGVGAGCSGETGGKGAPHQAVASRSSRAGPIHAVQAAEGRSNFKDFSELVQLSADAFTGSYSKLQRASHLDLRFSDTVPQTELLWPKFDERNCSETVQMDGLKRGKNERGLPHGITNASAKFRDIRIKIEATATLHLHRCNACLAARQSDESPLSAKGKASS